MHVATHQGFQKAMILSSERRGMRLRQPVADRRSNEAEVLLLLKAGYLSLVHA